MKLSALGVALVASSVFATEYTVSDVRKISMTATGDVLKPATTAVDTSLPEVGTPIFRFDAKNTTGWTFDSADATKIMSIPSSVGDRTLTLDVTGGDFSSFSLASPILRNDATLGNQPCVDFGAIGSKKGLLFNAVESKNELSGIGSVFMVFNSENGGGTFLGGGSGSNEGTANTYNMWLRGLTPNYPGSQWDCTNPYSFLLRYENAAKGTEYADVQAARGRVYHDGFVMSPVSSGLIGGWEVVSLQPLDNTLVATGVGLGYARGGFGNSSGGQRIAEMIVYGEVLSDENRAKVEAYLEKKWFGRELRSWGSNAAVDIVRASKTSSEKYSTNGAEVEATVGAGENLNIGTLFGGRGGYATFTKNGAGSLAIGDASAYAGTVHANGGTLAFAKRAIPEALPAGYCADFDASDSSTITTYDEETVEGISVKRVKKWTNKSDFKLNGYKICLAPNPDTRVDCSKRVPWVRANMLNGKAVLDFGFKSDSVGGNHLVLVREDVPTSAVKIQGVTTVLAVMSPHSGCPYNIVGGNDSVDPGKNNANARCYFNPTNHYHSWASPLFSETVLTYFNDRMSGANSITMWDNGIRHDPATGFAHFGWQVVAFANPGSQIGGVGMGAHYYYSAGQMCLAELVLYARPLTEQEILDAQAYLHYKWFGRETPGYVKTAERAAVPDVQKLAVDAASTIDVAAGTTVRIGTLSGAGVLTKTGAGTLEVEKEGAAKIVLKGGTVKTVAAAEPASIKTMAKDPATHFDASDESTLITRYYDSRDQVWMWYDKTGRNAAWVGYNNSSAQPWVNRTDTLNGRQVVDFGAKGSARFLTFAMPLDGIKAAFVVWGSQNGGGVLIGAKTQENWPNGDLDDFCRATTAQVTDPILSAVDTSQHVWGGTIFTNGTETSYKTAVPSGGWDLIEVYPQGAAHASALAYARTGSISGGQRLAEMILYERELSEREKVATRNYLMQKWFGKTDAELTPLPDAPAVETIKIEKIDVAAGETVTLDEDVDYEIGEITGAGDIVKNGTGDIAIGPADGFTGNLRVNSGKLTLTAMPQPKLATDGLEMWLDPTNVTASSITKEGTWDVVSNWLNQVSGSTLTARGHRYVDSNMHIPCYMANGGPNDAPYFYFPRGAYYRFKDNADNSYKRFTDIQTVFWVIGSQNGGGVLLGDSTAAGGSTGTPTFRRVATKDAKNPNGFPGYYASDPLLASTAQQEVREADWKENGSAVDPMTDGLSGGWDIVSCNLKADAAKATSADGLAYVGGEVGSQWCCGFQNLAEVLIYNRRLTPTEVCEVESYLADKYALSVGRVEQSFTNGLKVTLAQGASLESTDRSRYLDALSGAGSVTGDVTIGHLVANKDKTPPTVNGTVTIPANLEVSVESLSADWTPVLTATGFDGKDNLRLVKFVGEGLGSLRLRVKEGVLGVTAKGLVIIVQ